MIRLVALGCGLLCGVGFLISGLYDPALAYGVPTEGGGPIAYGLALFAIVFISAVLAPLGAGRGAPLLGGADEPLPNWVGRRAIFGALVFGLGWGVSGYFPLSAFVSAGTMAPGAAVFLAAVLFGMLIVDVATGKRR